jgi:hypothetical protein
MSSVWLQHEIAVDDHAHWKPSPNGQRRLNMQIASNHLLSGLVQRIGRPKRSAWRIAVLVLLSAPAPIQHLKQQTTMLL